ncbi:ABC transporter permease [Candidatus Thiothrix sp. Deng01]|uniref:ABC transporter permease n=1 Tax=Candidatus Thiothrix phosphatis TaxID=3112415 RepID=A0ABU6CTN9_9GAMM|nr:ABC transporter permease [Candidatus Thiothrix sp. Deng01]MEB4589763.1 ABC transporter permease [Candidatus Thiothrix sp. Deng01]
MTLGASLNRLLGISFKEIIQMRRDRLTFGMIMGIPIMQLLLFGFAINSDPKHLPTAILVQDNSVFTRTFVRSLENTGYFQIIQKVSSEVEANRLLAEGDVQFVVNIPQDFARKLVRGEHPAILLEADATDPAATSNALASLASLGQSVLNRDLTGPLAKLRPGDAPFEVRMHRSYNPEGITQYNIVPGLMGVILTMTMVLMTGLAMTRERERGTFENLLATPAKPLEVMVGKIVPYIVIGFVQMSLILLAAKFIFDVPFQGSLALLYGVTLMFIAANLTLGMTFSTIARNQLQAMQMTFFFFLPSILLSGFMFPFRGMPEWAQVIGNALPLTHFLRLVRGIMLKGNTLPELWPHMWPILLFMLVVMALGSKFYKRTLD